MNKEIKFKERKIQDYECSFGPRLLLIAEKPLEKDKSTIFDSSKGIDYLSQCFKSKFKAVDTHITYIKDETNSEFARQVLFSILEYYTQKETLDVNKLLIGFIGQDSFKAFEDSYNASADLNIAKLTLYRDTNHLSIFGHKINRSTFNVPYIILPNVEDDISNLTTTLNNTKIGIDIKDSIYTSTEKVIAKMRLIKEIYQRSIIKGFKLDFKLTGEGKVEYYKLYDNFSKVELIYSKNEAKKVDTPEIEKEYNTVFNDLLVTVPLYGENAKEILKVLKNYNCITFVDVNTVESYSYNELHKSFIFTGDETNPNGPKSEWYDKWYKEAYKPVISKQLSKKQLEVDRDGYSIPYRYEWVYDIEVFKYDWLFVAKTLDKKNRIICWNDADSLRKWIKDKILIGFNNSGYDDSVIRHAMMYPYAVEGTKTVKEFSDALVNDEEVKRYPEIKEKYKVKEYKHGIAFNEFDEPIEDITPPNFISWDVSLHLPFDIRRNSLKKLTMSVLDRRNYDSSVPFDIATPLTEEQRKEVEQYCEMDVDNTLDLFLPDPKDIEAKKENPKHKMREFAKDSYDIKWNLIVEYKMKALNLITKSASFAGKVLCGENAKPNLKNTQKEVNGELVYYSIPELALKELAGTPLLDFYLKHQHDPDYIREKFEYYMGGDDEGHLYQFGFGGLHQALLNYGSENLVNMDVASLYPSLLIQYDLMSRGAAANPDSYKQVYETRIEAKHTGKTLLNQGLKLVLNGAIGAMLSDYNPLYDTWSNSTVCVHGQLLLFILCKRLHEAGFNIVQTNTDGIMIEKQENIDYMPICEQWMKETRLVLEFDDIKILQQNNVNNYYCEFQNGKIKSKGFYLSNEKFGKATSKILCNMVTHKPLLEDVKPRDYVIYKRHGVGEIYDASTNKKLEGRSLAFVVGKPEDPNTGSYYSRSRNEREVVVKDDKGHALKDENGNNITETVNSISKITGFTDHMLIVDDVNNLTLDQINMQEYINFAKNLLGKEEIFGPYYDINYTKCEDSAYLQALNPLKDNTDLYPTKAGVICRNFLFECDYLSKEEQEELFKPIEQYTYRIVWSGHRSYHIVVRLNKSVTSTAYKKIWYYLKYKLGLIGADEQCSQPNRYTRTPDETNPKTGEIQTLYSENKYEFNLDEILENMPKLKDELKLPTQYKGKVDIKALERHIKRQDWSDGNRFLACQKLSPILISQVSMDELLTMIPTKLDKNHIYVLRAKYRFYEKNKDLYQKDEESE